MGGGIEDTESSNVDDPENTLHRGRKVIGTISEGVSTSRPNVIVI